MYSLKCMKQVGTQPKTQLSTNYVFSKRLYILKCQIYKLSVSCVWNKLLVLVLGKLHSDL